MRRRAVLVLVAAAVLAGESGCCRCCRCGRPRDDRLPPADIPREDRIPPGVLRPAGTPASLPKSDDTPRPTGAYGGS